MGRPEQLFDRQSELGELGALLAAVGTRSGRMLLFEGEAGIGKTTLLEHAVRDARTSGYLVATARGTETEHDFAFGVTRQLLESIQFQSDSTHRAQVSTHRAVVALADVATATAARAVDPGAVYGILQELYWLLVELSDHRPVLLVIDDAHWADEQTFGLLRYLTGRLDQVPVGVLVARRPPGRSAEPATALTGVVARRLGLLQRSAVASWLTHATAPVEPGRLFVDRLLAATGGNPFLIGEMIRELGSHDIDPLDGNLERLGMLTPESVSVTLVLRLAGASAPASTVADVVGVLEEADSDLVAEIAGLGKEVVLAAAEELRVRDVLGAAEPLRFLHPLIRTAMYRHQGKGALDTTHLAAARVLAARGEDPEVVAAQVMSTQARAPWAVPLLRAAAGRVLSLGGAATAAGYLRRALRDAPEGQRRQVEVELGQALATVDPLAAAGHLARAVDAAATVAERVDALVQLSAVQRYGPMPLTCIPGLLAARAGLAADDRSALVRLDVELLNCSAFSRSARLQLAAWRAELAERPVQHGPAEWTRLLAATAALDGALAGTPRAEVTEHVVAAVTGLRTAVRPELQGIVLSLAGLADMLIDNFDQAAAFFQVLVAQTRSAGLADRHAAMLGQLASLQLRVGDLRGARDIAQRALDLSRETGGARSLLPRAAAVLLSVAVEEGVDPPIELVLDDIDPDSIAFRLLAFARAEHLAARGQHEAAARAFLAYGQTNVELGWPGTASPWRSAAAGCLLAIGEAGRATALAQEEIVLARIAGAPRAVGVAVRAGALTVDGAARTSMLEEAVAVLGPTRAVLDHGWALAELGRDHLSNGHVIAARTVLAEARDIAVSCGAGRLAARTFDDLTSSGARPRRVRLRPADALTPSERVTAEHAVAGLTNRKIAQALFVTEKTVEAHLRSVFRKLDITSRSELPHRLAQATAAVTTPRPGNIAVTKP